jgi:hypothetical protein
MELGDVKDILESDNSPRELPNQIVYLLGALNPEIMSVWQSQVLGSYGTIVINDHERIMVIAHLEKDEESNNPFDKKITWWKEAGIHQNWRPPI